MSVGERTLTLVKFLKLPETRPAREFVNGRVVQKVSPKARHSRIQLMVAATVNNHARPKGLGLAFPELRCTFGGRSYVFDVSYFRTDRIAYGPDGELIDDVFLPPDLAVEIRSPGQTVRVAEDKLRWSIHHGVRLAWFIDPIRRRVRVFTPEGRAQLLDEKSVLDANDVIPEFQLPVHTVFDWLKRP
jgi:Uma2 family endonuclease